MTYRHMDLSPDFPVKGFMINIVTHHYDHSAPGYKTDQFDASAITEASRDLAQVFAKYATFEQN